MCVQAVWPGLLLRNTEEKGCCQVIAVSRAPPGDNKLILDVLRGLWEFRLIVLLPRYMFSPLWSLRRNCSVTHCAFLPLPGPPVLHFAVILSEALFFVFLLSGP